MNALTLIMLAFSLLGAFDRIIGGKLGLADDFEKGFNMLGTLCLSMIGMIVISPLIADLLAPMLDTMYEAIGIDPSIIPAAIFANDMGGAPLAAEVSRDSSLGGFNGLVVASMMGALLSFTIPFAITTVKKEHHRQVLLGLLCGVATIPVGCFIAGLLAGIALPSLLLDLLPLILFSALIALGLVFIPNVCVKIFGVLGVIIKILITAGLALSVIRYLTGIELVKGLGTLEEGASICLNICVILSGAFVVMKLVTRLLSKPFEVLGKRLGIEKDSTAGLVSTLVTSAATFEMMNTMDKKGIVLNSAFAVSAAFVFGDHLAFTLAYDSGYILPVTVGKLTSGICAVIVAMLVYKKESRSA